MKPTLDKDGEALESALLYLSRNAAALTSLLQALLPPAEQMSLVKSSGRSKGGSPNPAVNLANQLISRSKVRREICERVIVRAKECDVADALFSNEEAKWSQLAQDLLENPSLLPSAKETFSPEDLRVHPPGKATKLSTEESRLEHLLEEKKSLQNRLHQSGREKSELEKELHKERARKGELQQHLQDAVAQAQEEKQRATDLKHKWHSSSSASKREETLLIKAEEAQHDAHVALQKLHLIEEERDDLRGVLEDYDRFLHLPVEDVPSFRERPLLAKEVDMQARIAQFKRPLRILVVGGGEPQFKHVDKFQEYAEVMGFSGEWRMAEYVSWHLELSQLKRDMMNQFDALVILHWNRTTFTRKARGICNTSGQLPCITCNYMGFTNLRETLQTCLEQMLNRP
jgi:hypothetical protein